MATIDFVPWQSITVFLIEHLINSLIRDFQQNQILQNLAHYDPLTQVANRRLFNDRADQVFKRAKRYKAPVTMVLFDLDDFKKVNDTFGHEVGDLLLIKFAQIVQKHIRDTDTLARIGGDEFALMLPQTTMHSSQVVINNITDSLSTPYSLQGNKILIKSSIGVASVDVGDYKNLKLEKLIRCADKAVYEAKKVAGTYAHYTSYT